jgi:thermostable 8-oxoguanine DNA glycosylase
MTIDIESFEWHLSRPSLKDSAMIDPFNVTDFGRTERELEEYLFFCIAVANKTARIIAPKIAMFLEATLPGESPFDCVLRLEAEGRLLEELQRAKTGKYTTLVPSYPDAARRLRGRLATVALDELMTLKGVGEKTSRYFVLHSRRDHGRIAVIDTHILKYLRQLGHDVPKGLPKGDGYARLERLVIAAAEAAGMSMPDFDLAVWSHYASKGVKPPLPVLRSTAETAA